MNNKPIDQLKLAESLRLLNEQLLLMDAPSTELVVCGGSALIATGLVQRTTRDIDILAFMEANELKDSEPLPYYLLRAAANVARTLELPEDWLNNGPAMQFRMGLPAGFQKRLHTIVVGEKLTMHYIDRYDQIFFKTYASADRGGYHVSDLRAINPSDEELIAAA
ncbi:MAG: DUF6036 family nucleotidyltransferase [Lentisphaeria bacterium]